MESSSSKTEEINTNNENLIPESASKILYNSIIKIKINQRMGTGFFMKVKIRNKEFKFLITCKDIISKKDLNSVIDIYFGEINNEKNIKIKLDKNERNIIFFGNKIDITLIEILENDKISEDKFLIPDLNYKNGLEYYKGKTFYLAGYPLDEIYKEERVISSGRIINIINEIVFSHSLDIKCNSSGSPIYLIENKCVIGIHKAGDKIKELNYGIFIGFILDKLDFNSFNKKIIKCNLIEKNVGKYKYFYSLEEYKNIFFNFHKILSMYYNYIIKVGSLTYEVCGLLRPYLSSEFLNYYYFLEKINKKIISNVDKIEEELKSIISGLMVFFNSNIFRKSIFFPLNFSSQIYEKTKKTIYFQILLNKTQLNKNNKDKIIFFPESIIAKNYNNENIKYTKKNSSEYFVTTLIINYNYNLDWIPNLLNINDIYIFPFFSFFRIIKIEIDENLKQATIILDAIGRKEILEEKLENAKDIIYDNENKKMKIIY